jgi:glycosyltransferase involved in cell wall biosynthesis
VRIAWFSPFPPVRTGVAACSAELVAALEARDCSIDRYPEAAAHDFAWRHRQRPYDLVVYQFGNSSHHDYEWPYAFRYPGLVVLHDTHLHHARAALLLRERRRDDYRAEFRWSHPDVSADAAEVAIAGFDSRLFYEWPLVRGLASTALLVAVHGEPARQELIEALTTATAVDSGPRASWAERIVAIRLGHGQRVGSDEAAAARTRIRRKHGIASDAVVFGVFGGLTPEKRLPQILAAFRALLPYAPDAHLLLGGALSPHANISAADYADIAARVTATGYVDEADLTDYIAAVDVSLNLRWPTARETSGPWLRALAAGTPTIATELLQLTGVPCLDPRTWTVTGQPGVVPPSSPVTVAIDIVDEDHSLRLAMRRLAADADLRARLAAVARDYWQREHSIAGMADDYERVMREAGRVARTQEAPLPAHLRPSGDEKLQALLRPFGIRSPLDLRVGETEGHSPSDEK